MPALNHCPMHRPQWVAPLSGPRDPRRYQIAVVGAESCHGAQGEEMDDRDKIDAARIVYLWAKAEEAFNRAVKESIDASSKVEKKLEFRAFEPLIRNIKKNGFVISNMKQDAESLQEQLRKIGGPR